MILLSKQIIVKGGGSGRKGQEAKQEKGVKGRKREGSELFSTEISNISIAPSALPNS